MFPKPVLVGPAMGFSAPFRLSVKRMLGEPDDFIGAPLRLPYSLHRKVSKIRDRMFLLCLSKKNMKYLHLLPVD